MSIIIDCPVIKDAVTVRHTDWPRANVIKPTAVRKVLSTTRTFYDKPWVIGLAVIFCGGSQIRTPAVVFRCFLMSLIKMPQAKTKKLCGSGNPTIPTILVPTLFFCPVKKYKKIAVLFGTVSDTVQYSSVVPE